MTVKRHLCVAHGGLFFSNMEACPLCEEIKRFNDQAEELVRQVEATREELRISAGVRERQAVKIGALQRDIKHHSETFQGQMRTIDEQDEMIVRLKDTKPQTDYRETEATREKLRINAEVIRELETRPAGLEIRITHHGVIIRDQAETISEQAETIETEEDLPCKEPRRPSDERSRRGTEVSPRTWADRGAGP